VELQAEEEPGALRPVAAAAAALSGAADKVADTVMEKTGLKVAAWVAPVLGEALEQDGRGGFGCVAIDPPIVLSEAEAIEIIETELKAAGLKTELNVKVEGVTAPQSDRNERMLVKDVELTDKLRKLGGEYRQTPVIGKVSAVFDVADTEKRIFVEYLSLRDYDRWMGDERSTASSYNFPELVPVISEALGKRLAAKQEVYGVFFDPLARRPWMMGRGRIQGLTAEQKRLAAEGAAAEAERASRALPEKSREKLREQVRYFVKQLREKGVLPPA
jgi:hypothetical protein